MPVLQLRDVLLFGVPLALSASSLAAMHWYPWRGEGNLRLTRVEAYSMGTLVVVGLPVAAMGLSIAMQIVVSLWFWMALLVANMLVGGATVSVAYWVDEKRPLGLEGRDHDAPYR